MLLGGLVVLFTRLTVASSSAPSGRMVVLKIKPLSGSTDGVALVVRDVSVYLASIQSQVSLFTFSCLVFSVREGKVWLETCRTDS